MDHIYQRGSIYWIKYYRNGSPYKESSKSEKESDATKLLKLREGEIAKGEVPGVTFERILFDEIAEAYLNDYRVNKRKSLRKAEQYVDYLKESFEGVKVVNITTPKIKEHIKKKIEGGYENATINRQLSELKRMFTLAYQCTPRKVKDIPYIPMLKESNVRGGFFAYDQFLRLRNALPDYLRPVAVFGYHTGWRKGEVLGLTWDRVDLKAGVIYLNPGETKNDSARVMYMNEELRKEMHSLQSKRRLGCPYVFQHEGQPIWKFEKGWNAACKRAGLRENSFMISGERLPRIW